MGLRAGLTEIPSELFPQLVAGGAPEFGREYHRSIDKMWHEFHVVFRSKGSPLSLAISGDALHPQSSHSLDEFCEGGHDYYLGLMSPELVAKVAKELASVSELDYQRWESEVVGNRHGEVFFPELKSAYMEAAARKNGLMIIIC